MNNSNFTIITFYQFKKVKRTTSLKKKLHDFCSFNKLRGTALIAIEGVNGTLAGMKNDIELFIALLKNEGFKNLELKYSYYKYMPFNRLKIKIKKEIVTFRSRNIDPENSTGHHVQSKKWNQLIKNKDTIVIDVRNNFEVKMGSFQGAINPNTENFSQFKKYVDNKLEKFKHKQIAIFCTGGIRCEKASSYMINNGFKYVNQLKGGILKYLEDTKKNESQWVGECFVFDNRVSVQNELKNGTYELCHACRNPINYNDKKNKMYKKGVSCPNCFDKISSKKKKSLIERNKQINISKKKGLYNPYTRYTTDDFY